MAPAAPGPDDEWNLAIELWSFGRPESMNGHRIEGLQRKLGAIRITLDDLAELFMTNPGKLEQFLRGTCREHDLDLVAADLEEIGGGSVLVVWPDGSTRLYSPLPKKEWNLHAYAAKQRGA
jgi:hypothetical protein